MNKKKNIQEELIKIHTEKAQYELQKLKQSFRWKVGDAIARFIEFFLFRKPEKLSVDFIEDHLYTIDKLNAEREAKEKKTNLPTNIDHIYFLVSDDDCENSIFGDTHVANDFAKTLNLFFIYAKISLVKHNENFVIEPNSILINMLWQTELPASKNNYFSIAWIRNYADKWAENSYFLQYDTYLCSSQKIVDYIKSLTEKPVYLFPIGANEKRLSYYKPINNKIVFVGNKWNEERIIDRFLKTTKHKVEAYGKGRANKTIKNEDIPNLYQKSKIVIDAANETTLKWQSLNSRVFKAIAVGRLVLTNSIEAAKLFKNEIPVYKDEVDLEKQISFYLNNDVAYNEIVRGLATELLSEHDYSLRAFELKHILASKINIAIKIAATEENKQQFGDWYFAKSLAKSFSYYQHKVRIDCRENWNNAEAINDDLVIVLRGLHAYEPIESQCNFMWLISHPESVTVNEMEQYQHCFIASDFHYKILEAQGVKNISTLLQCTDRDLFYPLHDNEPKEEALLFVGNSRNVYRKAVKYAIELGMPIHVYGAGWKQFIPAKYIKAEFVPNEKLNELYNRYQIVLNDHWDDMLDFGYANNRMFDVVASGALLLSDKIKELKQFPSGLFVYKNKASFKAKIHEIKYSTTKINNSVLHTHSYNNFKIRAQDILSQYYKYNEKMV